MGEAKAEEEGGAACEDTCLRSGRPGRSASSSKQLVRLFTFKASAAKRVSGRERLRDASGWMVSSERRSDSELQSELVGCGLWAVEGFCVVLRVALPVGHLS